MHDWTGSTVRRDALKVYCRYCEAKEGGPCTQKRDPSKELEAFPAHTVRINDSQKAATK